ncbi:glycosyltransferase family 39 protein [Aquihabitans sp. G128]|uniref:glycosyltransferase family 39 protein n=1 Tax=Aquihabitans sp. G128 TaxID=2849779 RepID=UPI001C234992|nr:glycosyltransferase family 39 protein [Aquihabitans sp. G128]QXC61696.1 glycosyltransferase family 39 protein [Aquihabitans sp. G128]
MTDGPAPAPSTRPWRLAVLVVASLAFLGIGLLQASRDAPTVDEGVDVSSGVTSLVRHDLRLVPEHPALPKAVAALPALLAQPVVPDTAAYREGDWFDYSDDFIAANARAGTLRPMLVWARSVALLESIACAALIALLAKRAFGADGGLLAALAWLTTPYVVGLSHFAMIDVAFTLAVLGLALLLLRWRESPTLGRAAVLGLGLGGALASRHTGLVLLLVVVGVIAWTLRADVRAAASQVVVAGLVSVVVVWAVYRGLSPSGPPPSVAANFEGIIGAGSDGSAATRLATALPLPLEWRAGFAYLDLTSTARPASLFGRSWDGGRWWYFPASAALKLPLTLVLAVVAGWVVAVRDRQVDRRRLAQAVALPAVALWLLLVGQPLDLGLRLAMPVVALALVGLGALARPARRHRPVAMAVGVLLLVQVAASAVAAPHSLAWTPVPWTPAYRWVSDSNLDAGQALYEVRDWARAHDRPYVALDATRGLDVEGGSRSLDDVRPATVRGWVAVGVTPLMQTRRDDLAWLRGYCPVGTLGGGSVLVYRFTAAPDPAPGPERPVPACIGARASTRGDR